MTFFGRLPAFALLLERVFLRTPDRAGLILAVVPVGPAVAADYRMNRLFPGLVLFSLGMGLFIQAIT
jgi:hypothetical protein